MSRSSMFSRPCFFPQGGYSSHNGVQPNSSQKYHNSDFYNFWTKMPKILTGRLLNPNLSVLKMLQPLNFPQSISFRLLLSCAVLSGVIFYSSSRVYTSMCYVLLVVVTRAIWTVSGTLSPDGWQVTMHTPTHTEYVNKKYVNKFWDQNWVQKILGSKLGSNFGIKIGIKFWDQILGSKSKKSKICKQKVVNNKQWGDSKWGTWGTWGTKPKSEAPEWGTQWNM